MPEINPNLKKEFQFLFTATNALVFIDRNTCVKYC